MSQNHPDRLWGPHSLLFNLYQGSLPEVKRPEREVDHSPPSSAEVYNEWRYASTAPICLYGMDRDNSAFTVMYLGSNTRSKMTNRQT
jgi:hypothetical protein